VTDTSKIPVMITGVGGGGHGEQILKALKMADTPYEFVGGDMNPRSFWLKFVDHPYMLPPASDPSYIDALLAVCAKHNVKALFHGSEPELKVMSRNRDRLINAGLLLPINPDEVIDICMDKVRTMDFLGSNGFAHPGFIKVSTESDLKQIDFMPAVLKPSVGGGGSANIFLAQSKEELEFFARHLLDLTGPFICQEYMGLPENEYTVGVLLDMDGTLINSIAVRRDIMSALSNRIKAPNRTNRPELGPVLAISNGISQGEIGPFPEVAEVCEKVALALGCTGAVNIQCRLVNGRPYIFEINPRFSGTTSLRAMVGFNEPDVLIRKHVLNQEIPQRFAYGTGVICRGLQETLIQDVDYPKAVELPF
jgi:carbamoyl-phosphate synthase large subunit